MLLSDYQWSLNPRGLHNSRVYLRLDRQRYVDIGCGWAKLVAAEAEYADDCAWFASNRITPIVRMYREFPGAMPVDTTLRRMWRIYYDAGVRWFEFYNEPNLAYPEWPAGTWVDWRNGDIIRALCENWLVFAETIIQMGGYPAFPALSEAANETDSAPRWLDALLGYLRANHRDRFRSIASSGLWCATHPYTLNHFYQEVPGQPAVPRDPEQQNGTESGWHFEYPYDPFGQRFDPGRTVWGGTALTPHGDPNGLLAMGTAFIQRLSEWFGVGPVPVVGTEGGIHPLPLVGRVQTDTRYPWYDRNTHAEATVAMYNWLVTNAPAWMFGVTLWKEDDYFDNNMPALRRMAEVPQLRKDVPQVASVPASAPPGPGPVQGQPDVHMILLAPGLEPRWFFEAARDYWHRFRPIVTTTIDFINYFTYDRSLALTVIAQPEMMQSVIQSIRDVYPTVLFDLIAAEGDSLDSVAALFARRVELNSRFG